MKKNVRLAEMIDWLMGFEKEYGPYGDISMVLRSCFLQCYCFIFFFFVSYNSKYDMQLHPSLKPHRYFESENLSRRRVMSLSRSGLVTSALLSTFRRTFSSSAERVASRVAPSRNVTADSALFGFDISSQVGSCMPLSMMRIGTHIHNIEMRPGQGAKLVRAAGTVARILTQPGSSRYCQIVLPSGVKKMMDTSCKATVGQVSNVEHVRKKLRKAGHSRWLGRRPVVRGIAMNPVDHPHGGGEGKSKSSGSFGRGSRTPWGKPTKCGFKTGPLKRRK